MRQDTILSSSHSLAVDEDSGGIWRYLGRHTLPTQPPWTTSGRVNPVSHVQTVAKLPSISQDVGFSRSALTHLRTGTGDS